MLKRILKRFSLGDGYPVFLFSLVFYSGMWISKSLHPIWFDENSALPNFGIAYSVMAAAGSLSFVIGRIVARMHLRHAMLIGCVLYATGMGLRVFPQLPVAIISGFIAGLGASTALIGLSIWPFHWHGLARTRIYTCELWATNVAHGGVVAAAGLTLAFLYKETSLVSLLLFSAALPLVAIAISWRSIPQVNPQHNIEKPKPVMSLRRGLPKILIYLALCAVLSGLINSFIAPYLPVILKKAGFTPAAVMIFSGGTSLMIVVLQPYILKLSHHWGMSLAYMASITTLSVLTAPLYFSGWIWGVCTLLLLRRVAANMVALTGNAMKMQVIDAGDAAASMGILQSAFLLGDMFGGTVAGFVWSQPNANIVFPLVGLALIAEGLCFAWVMRRFCPDVWVAGKRQRAP